MPANCWPRLRTAAVSCAGVMTMLEGKPWENVAVKDGGEEDATSTMVDDDGREAWGGGGGGREEVGGCGGEEEVAGRPDIY